MQRSFAEIARGVRRLLTSAVKQPTAALRATMLIEDYRARRDRYGVLAREKGIVYAPARVAERTRERLRRLGLSPRPKRIGEVHTAAFVPLLGWHHQLLPHLRKLGPLSHFDYVDHGLDLAKLNAGDPAMIVQRDRVGDEFIAYLESISQLRPIDWIFIYAAGGEITARTLARAREVTKAPVVGMCLDDKQSWEGPVLGEQRRGQIDIAPQLDLAWTSARIACEWYMVEGGNPIFLPEGCLPEYFCPASATQDIDLCFVGQSYGFRQKFVEDLRSTGLRVEAAGRGWPRGAISDADLLALFQRSKIILGHGGVGWSTELRNVKGRDFDAPAIGTAAYLTTYNSDLLPFFDAGNEIVVFGSVDEAAELAARLLDDESTRKAIAERGRARCLKDHTWHARFQTVLLALGVV